MPRRLLLAFEGVANKFVSKTNAALFLGGGEVFNFCAWLVFGLAGACVSGAIVSGGINCALDLCLYPFLPHGG